MANSEVNFTISNVSNNGGVGANFDVISTISFKGLGGNFGVISTISTVSTSWVEPTSKVISTKGLEANSES